MTDSTAATTFNPGKGAGEPVGIALLGYGTVGSEVLRLMRKYADELEHRIGGPLELRGVASLTCPSHARACRRDCLPTTPAA